MRRLAIMAACALLALAVPALADATMIVILATPQRVVIASDSRRWIKDDDTGAWVNYFDDSVKVAFKGQFALIATGAASDDRGKALEILGTWDRLPAIDGESAAQRAGRLLVELQKQHVTPRSEILTLLAVVKFIGPKPDGILMRLSNAPSGAPAKVIDSAPVLALPFAFVAGWDEMDFSGVGSRLTAELTPDMGEPAMVDLARQAIAGVTKQTDKVGGPIVVAVIDTNGGRWLK